MRLVERRADRHRAAETVVLPREAISALPWVPFGDCRDIQQRVLWEAGNSYGGILRIRSGHEIASHHHHDAHHHVWVLAGQVEILGQRLGAGSYVHIPAGVEHHTKAIGQRGCELLYLYVREDHTSRPAHAAEHGPTADRHASAPNHSGEPLVDR